MASIGRLSNALLNAHQETTIALASINFDFSLIKYEAPAEYQALGQCLSRKRKEVAEDGTIHATARKLGALFESEIPDVPNLLEAYGKRVSEVAATPAANPQGTKSDGAFAEHVGADGTTIWASATSGKGVVTIHLLACMLARIWKSSEAVSIWSELVEQRKLMLANKCNSTASFHASDLAACRIEISRDQLAHWDASARSWIASADKAKELQHIQSRLVMENVSLPVSKKTDLYPAVVDTWKNAMNAVENLVLGRPQRIQSGEVLLGISAWHLYPDMVVMRDRTYHIVQEDKLVGNGGVITVGLEDSPDNIGDGIYWSLPLAHLRYYGATTLAKRHSGLRQSQLSFDQFRYVILGSVLSTWGPWEPNWKSALQLIPRLAAAYSSIRDQSAGSTSRVARLDRFLWLCSLAECCKALELSSDDERRKRSSLISFGHRKCLNFLSPAAEHPCPVFGLTDIKLILRSVGQTAGKSERQRSTNKSAQKFSASRDESISASIKFLRTYACMKLDRELHHSSVIRYRSDPAEIFRYTNVFEKSDTGRKRRRNQASEQPESSFLHWQADTEASRFGMAGSRGVVEGDEVYYADALEWDDDTEQNEANRLFPPGPGDRAIEFSFVCGDANTFAIFRPTTVERARSTQLQYNNMSVLDLLNCLEKGHLYASDIVGVLLDDTHQKRHQDYFDSLQALYKVESLYCQLPGARVDLQVTSRPVTSSTWARTLRAGTSLHSGRDTDSPDAFSSLVQAFCCIAMFETGFLDVDPKNMNGVIALSYKDSLYVAGYLLEDPANRSVATPIKRIAGNVGKPGFSLITTPEKTQIRAVDYDSWQVVEHKPCDGEPEDHFSSTSLHLWLTGYELPLDVGTRGSRDAEVSFVEAVISVHEGGKWIADLDVVAAREADGKLKSGDCGHSIDQKLRLPREVDIVSLQNWAEFLDPPSTNCVFMAAGNTLARFAASVLCFQKGYRHHVIGADSCWPCALAPPVLDDFVASTSDSRYTLSASSTPSQSGAADSDGVSDDEMILDPHRDSELFPDASFAPGRTQQRNSTLDRNCTEVFIW